MHDHCPECEGRCEVPVTPGQPGDGLMPCPLFDAQRRELLEAMSAWSEDNWAAGWMHGTEKMLYEYGGIWEILGREIGWPTGYEHDADFRWVSWDEAGVIFAERDANG